MTQNTQNSTLQTFPILQVREQFPALQRRYKDKQVVYFDGPGGSQVVKSAIDAITAYMVNGGANLHGFFPSSRETEQILADSRQAVADLLGTKAEEVAFGANMTTLTLSIARALGQTWQAGDELVVTEMDHRANVDPWLRVAQDVGMTVRWLQVNSETLTLDLSEIESVITEKTKLVAVGMASNAVGTVNEVQAIATRAKAVGALVAVDAVHAAPHFAIDRDELGVDILVCSAYKFFGPHVGVATIRSGLFESLNPYKLQPAPINIPDKLETGTQNHEGIAGIVPAIEFIANFGEGETRRERIISGLARVEAYEHELAESLRSQLAAIPGVHLYQADPSVRKTPTVAFRLDGYTPATVCEWMTEEKAIFVADGHFYASTLAEKLGIAETGWIRAGLAPYNSVEEVDRFCEAVRELAEKNL